MSLCAKFHAFVPICAIHVFFRPNSPHSCKFVDKRVVLEMIVMIFRPQVSNSIHRVGNKRKERNSYTVMSDDAFNKRCVFYAEYLTH